MEYFKTPNKKKKKIIIKSERSKSYKEKNHFLTNKFTNWLSAILRAKVFADE